MNGEPIAPATLTSPPLSGGNDLRRLQKIRGIALVPVVAAGIFITGQQYVIAVVGAGGNNQYGWRSGIIDTLASPSDASGIFAMTVAGVIHVVPVFVVALITALLWERLFSTYRERPMQSGLGLVAMTFTLLLPPAVSLWHVIFGMSFGVVFGRCIFGGEGKTFLNPALLAAMILQVSFPSALYDHPLWAGIDGYSGTHAFAHYADSAGAGLLFAGYDGWRAFLGTMQGLMGTTSLAAILIGCACLVIARAASWRLIAAHVFGLIGMALVVNSMTGAGPMATLAWYWHLMLGAFGFGVVFVATDPASAACTPAGRWIQGALIGAVIVVLRTFHPAHPDAVIPALLLGSIIAPLIDHGVMAVNIRKRRLADG